MIFYIYLLRITLCSDGNEDYHLLFTVELQLGCTPEDADPIEASEDVDASFAGEGVLGRNNAEGGC